MYCARGRGRRGAPSGEACGSSRRGELRGRVGLSRSLQRCVGVAGDHNRPAELALLLRVESRDFGVGVASVRVLLTVDWVKCWRLENSQLYIDGYTREWWEGVITGD